MLKNFKFSFFILLFILQVILISGCGSEGGGNDESDFPLLFNITPDEGAVNVPLNVNIIAVFDRQMNKASVEQAGSIILKNEAGQTISASVTYNETTFSAVIVPSANLVQETKYTVFLTKDIISRNGNPLKEAYTWSFETDDGIEISPVGNFFSGAVNLPVNLNMIFQLNRDLDASTITVNPAAELNGTSTSIILQEAGGGFISGTVSYNSVNRTITVNPSVNLEAWTEYTLTITDAVLDTTGIALAGDYIYTFTTSGEIDTENPVFAGASSATALDDDSITLSWTAASDDNSASGAIIYYIYTASVSGTENYSSPSYITSPGATSYIAAGLNPSTTYYFTVLARDEAGNFSSTFTEVSAATSDSTEAPVVVSIRPAESAVNIAINTNVVVTFDKEMDPSTIISANVTLEDPLAVTVAGSVSYNASTLSLTFNPDANLANDTVYTFKLTSAIKDSTGNALDAFQYSFITIP